MIRFALIHIGVVVAVIITARRAISTRHEIPTKTRVYHYACLSFLVFMNFSGLTQSAWTIGRWLEGDVVSPLRQHFIAIRELPSAIALAIWIYSLVGRSVTALLVLGVARSSDTLRRYLIMLFPLLVLADGIGSWINVRGPHGLGIAGGTFTEYAGVICIWCLLAWPYIPVYWFYRSHRSDALFVASSQ